MQLSEFASPLELGLLEMSASMTNTKKIQLLQQQQPQGLLSSTLKMEEDTVLMTQQKQGIVTILGCDSDTTKNTASGASSLRRALSADMSSKKWFSQNGSMKKIASSEQLLQLHPKTFADSSSSEGEDDYEEETKGVEADHADAEAERERLEIWSSIQRNKTEEQEKAGAFDTWGSIISLKTNDEISKSLPAGAATPYVHPLGKRTKSSLSEKSLEICTESLGSETGSDGLFSSESYPPSETGDTEEEEEEEQKEEEKVNKEEESEAEESEVVVTASATKKSPSPPRCFPPPLPSLISRQTGPSLHMRPHRDNGRLVLEAVSLPSLNNFSAQRQDGRLVLTFATQNQQQHQIEEEVADHKEKNNGRVRLEELEEEFGGFEEDHTEEKEGVDEDEDEYEDEDEDDEAEEVEVDVGESESDSGITSVQRLAFMVNNKPIGLVNRNPKWSEKFNEVANFEDVNVKASQVAQSLPPRPRVPRLIPSAPASATSGTGAASFDLNAYEHYWRTKPTGKSANYPLATTHQENKYNNYSSPKKNNVSSKIIVSNEHQQQVLVLRGKNGDYLVHNLKSCKDSRRSFLFWEPYCIATS